RSVPNAAGLAYADIDADGDVDLYVTNGNGIFQDVTASADMTSLSTQLLLNSAPGRSLAGTTAHFMHIGQSVLALLTAIVGGQISRRLYAKNRSAAQAIRSDQT